VQRLLRRKSLTVVVLVFSILSVRTASAQTPAITTQPTNQTVTAGQTATFSVALSNGPCRSFWYVNGTSYYGAYASTILYSIPNTTAAMNGWKVYVNLYDCGSSGASIGNSQSATLTVTSAAQEQPVALAPTITTQPTNQTVTAGQTSTFSAAASGTAPLSYQWELNGANISGATSSSYTTPATTTANSGSTFAVVVTNSAGSLTSRAATLTVNAAVVAPTITTQPANQNVTVGQTATFSVAATGTGPISYQWQKSGVSIGGATSSSYTTPATTAANSGSTYAVLVSNSAGSATSNGATLTVNAASGAPAIVQQPQSQTVQVGQSATFTVVVSNGPCRSIWYVNGTEYYGSDSSTISFTISNGTAAMNGWQVYANLYGCGSTGANLGNTQTAILTVAQGTTAPTIVTQPTNQTVTSGQTATFSVAANGTAPLSYQWQKNGVNISGATSSSYITPANTAGNSGSTYDVVVSNSVGSVTSSAATLAVSTDTTPPTVSITSPSSGSAVSGTITVAASASDNIAVASVQFQVDGTNVGAIDTSSPYNYSLNTSTLSNGTHDLTAVATDTSGNQATSISVPITVSNRASSGAVPTYANNGSGCPINTVVGGPTDAVTQYNCPLPNPTGAGNLLVVWMRYNNNNVPTVTISDNAGNSYTQAVSCSDASNGNTVSRLYYAQNVKAGANLVTAAFSASSSYVQMQPYEFYNIATTAPLDQAVCQASSGTSISTGLLPDLAASGDLVVHFGSADNGTAIGSCSAGTQSNITWKMRAALVAGPEPMCFQYGVYGATAAFNPTMAFNTSVSYVSLAAAFKSAPAGTPPPSGIRVAYVQHDNGGSLTARSIGLELPLSGNLAVEVAITSCGSNTLNSCNYATSVSDGTNSWSQIGSTYLSSTGSSQEEPGQIWYAKNAIPGLYILSNTENPSSSGAQAPFPLTWMLYDIAGASSNPLDLGFGGAGNGLATFSSTNSAGPVQTFAVTPSSTNELIITGVGYEWDTFTGVTSLSGAQFLSCDYAGETNYSWVDSNGGYAIFYNGSSTAAETWTWTHDTSQQAGSGRGLAIGAAFQPATP